MKPYILAIALIFSGFCQAQNEIGGELAKVYEIWRNSIVGRDARTWQQVTAPHRRAEVRNRILSEKLQFPSAIFDLPAPPPSLKGLRLLQAKVNGRTAKASYFGEVDFGVGGDPSQNLLVLSFVRGSSSWLYDRADFVNLTALKEVRGELAKGDLSYLEGVPEARPSGVVPPTPILVNPATTIAKVYVFSPGREVQVQVNKVSRHRFANAKEAETVIGGARIGLNEIQYSVRQMEGGTGKEAMTIRVYLMSEVDGLKPIKAFEYQVLENEAVKPFDTGTFVLDAETSAKLSRR
ncbi:hypothetical protein [Luteolibacter sp. AS25]|uniref:hypothetical protein n=1 Tax=Luteolibacter sp. AS25 TaxID=3135776 RepID=UPI00398AB8A8